MFSLERALIGFAARVGDSVSRRPAMHVVGSLVAFGLLAVGILLVEMESDVFKLWVRFVRYFFVSMHSLSSSRRVLPLSPREGWCQRRRRVIRRRTLGEESARDETLRSKTRARRWAVRSHFFFSSSSPRLFYTIFADADQIFARWRSTKTY